MKNLRVILIAGLMLIGFVASVAPTLAASHSPTHPAAGYVLDDQPTPTPTPIPPQPNNVCWSGC